MNTWTEEQKQHVRDLIAKQRGLCHRCDNLLIHDPWNRTIHFGSVTASLSRCSAHPARRCSTPSSCGT